MIKMLHNSCKVIWTVDSEWTRLSDNLLYLKNEMKKWESDIDILKWYWIFPNSYKVSFTNLFFIWYMYEICIYRLTDHLKVKVHLSKIITPLLKKFI